MALPESEDIYTRREIATKEGLKINAVKDKQHAVVSTNKKMFTRLQERVGKYRESGSLNYFQFVDKFEPLSIEDKQSKGLVLYLEENQDKLRIDIQVMLVPNLDPEVRDRAVERLESEIRRTNDQHYVNRYELSDGTPVIRADMPMKDVDRLSEDTAVFRVEQTSFFSPGS